MIVSNKMAKIPVISTHNLPAHFDSVDALEDLLSMPTQGLVDDFAKLEGDILVLGVGISYYAFERYSMTHVYEAFSLTMLIYFSIKFKIFGQKHISIKWFQNKLPRTS